MCEGCNSKVHAFADGNGVPFRIDNLHCILQFFEGAHLDLTHTLARDAEFAGEIRQTPRVIRKPTRLKDAPFACVEHAKRVDQCSMPVGGLFDLNELVFLVVVAFDQQILPFAFGSTSQWRVERRVSAHAAVHVDNFLFRHPKVACDEFHLICMQIVIVKRREASLQPPQIKEQLSLIGRRAIFTSDQERRTYSRMAALIHQTA